MATTNYFKVKLLDEKLIPFLGLGERGPRENVILSSNDLASLKQAGWTVTDVQPLPETGKIKYDRRTVYFKSEGETGKFINVPFYINPVDARDVLGLLKFDLIKLSDKSVVKTYTAKDVKSEILSLPTSDLEVNEEYELKLYFPKDASEKYDIAISEGHKNLFERVKDSVFIKVKEYGKFTGRLVQLQQDINVLKESVLPLDKILGYKDFDTKEVTPVAKENLLQLLSVNISDESYARYQSDKNRLLFFSKTGEILVKVIERNIQDNIVNFNIRILDEETIQNEIDKKIEYSVYDPKDGKFESINQTKSITVTPETVNIEAEQTQKLEVTTEPEGRKVSFELKDGSEFASVDNNGNITGISEGTANVTVKSDDVSKNVEVNVSRLKTKSLTVTPEEVNIDVESTQQLDVKIQPSTNSVSYSITEGSEFASVDNKGLVTAKAVGTAKVKVSSDSVSKDVIINVSRVKTKSLTVTPEEVNIDAESTQQLTVNTDPKGNPVSYSITEGSDFASVNSSGLVTAKAVGTAKVKIVSDSVSKTVNVNVTRVKTKSLTVTPDSVDMKDNETQQLTVTTDPEGNPVSYSITEGTDFASVNNSGLVTAKAAGTAKVKVTSDSVSKDVSVTISTSQVEETPEETTTE
ncbi:hypothetical protein CPT_Madawaska_150 [Staphylococcus phage Madawaska]|nr:hypothetical protein CPT_Madawaska_150 [Staphylococcus phage Madawaska]